MAQREARTAGGRRRAPRLAGRVAPWAGAAAFAWLWWRERRAARTELSQDGLAARLAIAEPDRGRRAETPPQVPAKGWKDVLWRVWLEIGRDRLPATAGGVTFYTLLAIFPGIGAFVSVYGLFADVGEVSRQLSDLAAFVPAGVLTLVAEQMIRLATARPEALSVAFVISLMLSLWSANAGVAALFDGLNVVYAEKEKRNFFLRRLLTYAFTFCGLIFAVLTTTVLVAAPIALRLLGLGETLLVPLRWILVLAMAAVAFAVVYRFGPSRQQARWSWVWAGAAVAALAWVGGSLGFSWYVNHLAHYDVTYGPLGAVMGFMMWIWVSVVVVLLGAELNAELEHQTVRDTTTGAPRPMGLRGAVMADTVGVSSGGFRKQAGLAWAMLRRQARRLRATPARPPGPPGERPGPPRSAAR